MRSLLASIVLATASTIPVAGVSASDLPPGKRGLVEAAGPARPAHSNNAELSAMFEADQADRAGPAINWRTVTPRDEKRHARTQALLEAGALASGDDYYHAALIFQHGANSDDYLKAHVLATIAVARGQADATWIAAATLDRFLLDSGRSQVLGTQFKRGPDGHVSQEPYARALLPDSVRAALGVPSLADQRKRVAEYEAEAAAEGGRVASSAAVPPSSCTFPGMAEMIAARHPHFLVIGEQRGTVETPATFAEIVCVAAAQAPVAVALDQPEISQAALDSFIRSDGSATARSALLADAMWHYGQEHADGRSSEATLALIDKLRVLYAAGRVTRVIAVQPTTPTNGIADYNRAMATLLMRRAPPEGLTAALVGDFHAIHTTIVGKAGQFLPMAAAWQQRDEDAFVC